MFHSTDCVNLGIFYDIAGMVKKIVVRYSHTHPFYTNINSTSTTGSPPAKNLYEILCSNTLIFIQLGGRYIKVALSSGASFTFIGCMGEDPRYTW